MPAPKTYQPVVPKRKAGAFEATALVGTHSAILGWTMDEKADRKDLLGFGIRRTDYDRKTGKLIKSDWLPGLKRFEGIKEDVKIVGSNEAPFQRFRWNDYTLRPDKSYTYEIVPVTGKPAKLEHGKPLMVDVFPSPPMADRIGVYFNRGVTSAMAYLDRFEGKSPEDVKDGEAYTWLSRGLKESLLAFIADCEKGESLHICIYEFFDEDVAQALADRRNELDIGVVYHSKAGTKAATESKHNIDKHKIAKLCVARKNTAAISHNKFAVRLKDGKARSVWTGSSNFSTNAFYFQTNNAMHLDIPAIAQVYEEYFQVLHADPKPGKAGAAAQFTQDAVAAITARFKPRPPFSKAIFSPVRSLDLLDVAGDLIKNAQSCVFVSAPFGMESMLVDVLKKNDPRVLEYGLVNTTAKKKIDGLVSKHMRFLVPEVLTTYMGRKWDAKAFGQHKIHSKLIIADPWSKHPRVLVGSSNHSDESCKNNDENNLLIEGDSRIAAIMATEFMRMFDHYNSRNFINHMTGKVLDSQKYLILDGSWSRTAFSPRSDSHKYRDRQVFSGG